jgi:hypothetical protein
MKLGTASSTVRLAPNDVDIEFGDGLSNGFSDEVLK